MRWAWVLLLAAGCSTSPPPSAPAKPSYKIDSMRWLPPGNEVVYAYKTEDLIARSTGILSLRLRNPTADSIELVTPQRSETLRYQPSGILRERTGSLMLRTPPEVGARWPSGPGLSARIARVDLRVSVEAGSFEGCMEVLEERTVPFPGAITTTYCPDVGIVRIETVAEEPPIHERVELRSFGQAIDLKTVK
ncbi:MAG: hypothetical protein MUF64_11440 [Polyangiaceae bacterium]|nr:hypothetical protein [Polyangiaceae bacterium]